MSKTTQTIDITPTWQAVLPMLLAAHASGSFEGVKAAEEELLRMAKLADAYVAAQKEAAK